MISNGDFENGTTGWTFSATNSGTKTSPQNDLYSNATVAFITSGGSISQTVTGISENCPYQLSFGLKDQNNQKPCTLEIVFQDAAHNPISIVPPISPITLFTNGTGFTTFIYRFNAPATTAEVVITFENNNTGTSEIDIDNVIFSRG